MYGKTVGKGALWLLIGFCVAMAVAMQLEAVQPALGDAAFRAPVDKFIDEEFQLSPEFATGAGDHRFDAKAADLSGRGVRARIVHAEECKEAFSAIDPKTLSSANEADREWLLARCDGELLRARDECTWDNPASYVPTESVYVLIERNFAPAQQRIQSVTARETAWLKNFAAARKNLKPKCVSKVAIDITLQQMPATLDFFKDDLPAAFAAVPDGPAKKAFKDANRKTIAALGGYQEWLKDQFEPKATGTFAIGGKNYERMLADDDMVDLPLAKLEELGEREMRRLKDAFRVTAAKINPEKSPAEVMGEVTRDHPSADQVIARTAAGLRELRDFVFTHHLATIPSDVMPSVKETPPYARATTFASIDPPGPFEKSTEAYFYVTLPDPSWPEERKGQLLRLYAPVTISDISVHEVFPGHYVQFLDMRLNQDKVRALFQSGSNSEGWALYCEQMMLDEGLHDNDPKYRLAQLQLALQRACRYLAAIRMHTEEMTVEQAARFFEQNAYMTPHNAMVEALRGTQDPGYLRYELGKLMILRLREDVRKKEGAAFDLGRFHDAFLEQGGLPLKLIRRAMLGADGPLL